MSDVKAQVESGTLSGTKTDDEVCNDSSRRELLAKLGMGSLIIAAAGAGLFTYEFFSPNVLFEAPPIVKAGKPDQFPANSVTLDAQSGIYVVNGAKGFYALGAICTHLGCLTAWKPELDLIACPCHGSRFNRDGVKVAGPAPQPLPWMKVWLSDDGYLMVDRSSTLKEPEYVKV
ncbi:MAG TPA: Rieske 2Fe-2S domain-containing protein [Candidatus Dormibacteraeota bacterium]|jgi:cytochrome b6-f complex iron-sulfur subunit|nr:Rieske 2Fe-2S domain-containing protein [Candidatus Dormibacteraeota bacterium]